MEIEVSAPVDLNPSALAWAPQLSPPLRPGRSKQKSPVSGASKTCQAWAGLYLP